MAFELPSLPFDQKALEPLISEQTVFYHYEKHHKTYVEKTNKQVEGTTFANASLETIIKEADGGIYNNGAQTWNHTFYWNSLDPDGGGKPSGDLLRMIERDFGSFEEFKTQFTNSATTLFGSGWIWLALTQEGKLTVLQKSNAGNPLRDGMTPLLTCDVWEHAYYLDRQNRKPEYVDAFWKLVNWNAVVNRL
ncbi:MAG: superoxide dismutase [Bacteroidales bacterium]|nr:superoxide dismutase [Bacteroidales bacterium]MCF8332534.1 superoxide dismutase [Bacteroidales bacterium]